MFIFTVTARKTYVTRRLTDNTTENTQLYRFTFTHYCSLQTNLVTFQRFSEIVRSNPGTQLLRTTRKPFQGFKRSRYFFQMKLRGNSRFTRSMLLQRALEYPRIL